VTAATLDVAVAGHSTLARALLSGVIAVSSMLASSNLMTGLVVPVDEYESTALRVGFDARL
jgi:hypothetical protein